MRAVVLPLVLLCVGCPSVENYYRTLDLTERTLDVAYVDDGHPKHRLDLYVPVNNAPGFSTVVFIHGGYWRAGDKNYLQPVVGLYGNVGTSLAEVGIGTVVSSYRLLPEATFEQMLDDVVGALAWARDNVAAHGGDPTSLFLAGHSAGGHLVAFLGAHPEEIRARGVAPELVRGVISLSGIYDVEATTARVSAELREEVFLPLFGKTAAEQRAASPNTGFGPGMIPMAFIVGELDYKSCSADQVAAEKQLAALIGSRAFFWTIPGNKHEDMVLDLGTRADPITPLMAGFVRHLR